MSTAWFILLAAIFTAYAVLDGFDLGVGAVYRFAARSEVDRRTCLASIGPLWNGNEVWLIAGGGSLFFSFPRVYASGFSGFYLALMLVLWLLILRGIALEFRNQLEHELWREFWDNGFAVGSLLLALLLGVALGNVARGLPLNASGTFQGSFGLMLGGYQLLVGGLSASLLSLHGANYLRMKTEGELQERSRLIAQRLGVVVCALAIAVTAFSAVVRPHLIQNFVRWPLAAVFPTLAAASLVSVLRSGRAGQERIAFLSSSALIIGLLGSTAASIYPELLHSTVNSGFSLTVYNASASSHTLWNGLLLIGSALVVVAGCQFFVYRRFLGKTGPEGYGGH